MDSPCTRQRFVMTRPSSVQNTLKNHVITAMVEPESDILFQPMERSVSPATG